MGGKATTTTALSKVENGRPKKGAEEGCFLDGWKRLTGRLAIVPYRDDLIRTGDRKCASPFGDRDAFVMLDPGIDAHCKVQGASSRSRICQCETTPPIWHIVVGQLGGTCRTPPPCLTTCPGPRSNPDSAPVRHGTDPNLEMFQPPKAPMRFQERPALAHKPPHPPMVARNPL